MWFVSNACAPLQIEADKDAHDKIGSVREMYAFVAAAAVERLDLELQVRAWMRTTRTRQGRQHGLCRLLAIVPRGVQLDLQLQPQLGTHGSYGSRQHCALVSSERLLYLQAPPESTLMIQPPVQDSVGAATQVRTAARAGSLRRQGRPAAEAPQAGAQQLYSRAKRHAHSAAVCIVPPQLHYTWRSALVWPNGTEAWRLEKRDYASPELLDTVGAFVSHCAGSVHATVPVYA